MKLVIFALLFTLSIRAQEKALFLHVGGQVPSSMDLSGIRNSPTYLPIDCREKDCSRYKVSEFPTLLYWKGPGSAFQKVSPPTEQAIRSHLLAKEVGMVNRFRIFLEQISLFTTFVLAFLFGGFLYTVFTLLFTPRKPKIADSAKIE